eukprot:1157998-Pelagomonas_calceolata.AAC.3
MDSPQLCSPPEEGPMSCLEGLQARQWADSVKCLLEVQSMCHTKWPARGWTDATLVFALSACKDGGITRPLRP